MFSEIVTLILLFLGYKWLYGSSNAEPSETEKEVKTAKPAASNGGETKKKPNKTITPSLSSSSTVTTIKLPPDVSRWNSFPDPEEGVGDTYNLETIPKAWLKRYNQRVIRGLLEV